MNRRYRYDRTGHPDGSVILRGVPEGCEGNLVEFEFNIISRWVWGLGASVNEIFNAHGPVHFRSSKEKNERRAKLVTYLWRLCRKLDIAVHPAVMPARTKYTEVAFTEDKKELHDRILLLAVAV